MDDKLSKSLSVTPTDVHTITDAQDSAPASMESSMNPHDTSLSGRVRKATQVFTFAQSNGEDPEAFLPAGGNGVKVRDMDFVKNNVEALGKKQYDMIKQLYSIMYGRRFQQKNVKLIKEHILDFSGIIEQDEKSREQLMMKIGKWKMAFLHEVMDLLAISRSKKSFEEEGKPHNKESLIDRLIDWLYNPQVTKLGEKKSAILEKKSKRKAKTVTKKATATSREKIKPTKKKQKTSKKLAPVEEIEEEEEDEQEAIESESDESSSDFEETKELTKKRKITRPSKKLRHDSEEDAEVEKEDKVDDRKSEHSESEVESHQVKQQLMPETAVLDAEIADKVKDIIAQGNSEELTVKQIIRQLSSDLGRDMSTQKKAIKAFITSGEAT